MFRKLFPVLFILSLVVPFASCAGNDITAQEIAGSAIEAASRVSTYTFDSSMDVDMSVVSDGQTYTGFIALDSSGTADTENRKLQMDVVLGTEFTGQESLTASVGMFVLDGSVYMKINAKAMGDQDIWIKSRMPDESLEGLDQLEPYVGLLENATRVVLSGSETIDGTECYVLEVTPDLSELWSTVMQQSALAELSVENILPSIDPAFIGQVFDQILIKQWISKDDFLPVKTTMDMSLDITPEAIGYPDEEGQMNLSISIVASVSDYNQPVDIQLPEGAQGALEVPVPII